MARKVVQAPIINEAELKQFEREASRYQRLSNCLCPDTSRLNAVIARKYLFHIINTRSNNSAHYVNFG